LIDVEAARPYYAGADAVHDFDHVLRVLALAERIGRAEAADMAIVRAAVLLHDVGRGVAETMGVDHAAYAAERARDILSEWIPTAVEPVIHAIAAHRFRSLPEPATLEARVLFDADKLDAIGAIGVARAFAYGGAHGQRLWAPPYAVSRTKWEQEGDDPAHHTPVHEFVIKLSRLRDRLFTSTGRAIAGARHAYMVGFFERLQDEVRGIQ
jgi:uncharacterized protein